jgi:hypothetical protein
MDSLLRLALGALVLASALGSACGFMSNPAAPGDGGGDDVGACDACADARGDSPTDGVGGDAAGDAPASGDGSTEGPQDGAPPYPTRTAYRIKALQPDFWPNEDDVSGNNAGGVAMNLVWASWEAAKTAPPCAAGQDEYDGHCFTVDANVDAAIASHTARGLVVTGVVYGTPAWARRTRPCPLPAGSAIFCVPDSADDYARFAGLIARRYDGLHGHGRVADFVIHNEVNASDWFSVGCGNGTPCDTTAWLDAYAANYAGAFDRIAVEQSSAKVLVSLDQHFGAPDFDQPTAAHPLLSGMTVLTGVAARVAPRAWRVAFHPYPPDLLKPDFSPDDWPKVTYGDLGALSGWLRKTFPQVPSSWEIQLTESGVNSLAPDSTEQAQSDGVCASFLNALGTPGVENYVYHRMVDNPVETAAGLGVGLHAQDGGAKLAWATWALANRNDLSPPQLSCGFQDLPYVRLVRSYLAARGHWASTRRAPPGFVAESSWRLWRDDPGQSAMLYECRVAQHDMLSTDAGCEGQLPLGPVGYARTTQVAGSVALYRCRVGQGTDHFVSTDPVCEEQAVDLVLGYVMP